MKSKIKRGDKKAIELELLIPKKDIKDTYDKVLSQVVKNAEVKGFRKGKAPKDVVEKNVDKGKLYEQVLSQLLPKYYSEAVSEHKISPVVSPRITPILMEEGKDWSFKAETCEQPEVDLGDYKDKVKKEGAVDTIWVPGKDKGKKEEENKEVDDAKKVNKAIEILLKEARVELADILVEDEVKRRLSQTLDEVKKLGLSLDEYLRSSGKTIEQLKDEQKEKAEETLRLEFILNKIAEDEKIKVEEKDIDEAINKAPSTQERERLEQNKYVLAMLLRRQKVLEFLKGL